MFVAAAFALLAAHASPSGVGAWLAAAALAQVAVLPVLGGLGDSVNRRSLLVCCEVARGAVELLISYRILEGRSSTVEVGSALVFVAAVGGVFEPAAASLLPSLVQPELLQRANAVLSFADGIPSLVGPAVGGTLVATAGPGFVFLLDAVSFLGSAFFIARIPRQFPADALKDPYPAMILAGWRYVASQRWLLGNLIAHAGWGFGISFLYLLGPLLFFQRSGGAAAWGAVAAAMSAGGILGGLAGVRLVPRRPLLACQLCLLLGIAPVLALAQPSALLTAALAAGAMAGGVYVNSVWSAYVQAVVPSALMGRVTSVDMAISWATGPLGLAVAAPLSNRIGTLGALCTASAVIALPTATLLFMRSSRRQQPMRLRGTPSS